MTTTWGGEGVGGWGGETRRPGAAPANPERPMWHVSEALDAIRAEYEWLLDAMEAAGSVSAAAARDARFGRAYKVLDDAMTLAFVRALPLVRVVQALHGRHLGVIPEKVQIVIDSGKQRRRQSGISLAVQWLGGEGSGKGSQVYWQPVWADDGLFCAREVAGVLLGWALSDHVRSALHTLHARRLRMCWR